MIEKKHIHKTHARRLSYRLNGRISLREQIDLEKKMRRFASLAVFLFCGSLVFYLGSTNMLAAKGSDIRSVERELASLQKEVEQLEIQEAQLRSLVYQEDVLDGLHAYDVSAVPHIEMKNSVAMR